MIHLLGHDHLLSFWFPHVDKNPLTHIYDSFSFMYDAHLITVWLWYIYCENHYSKRLLFLYFSLTTYCTHFTQLARHHRGTTEPPSFTTLTQTSSYLRRSTSSYPLIDTSFTHSCECYCHSINFDWFYITWVNFPRTSINSLSSSRKRGTHLLSGSEHQPT